MVVQGAPRRLGLARALKAVDARAGAHMLVENRGICEDLFDLLNAVKSFDQPRVMIVEGALKQVQRPIA